MMWRRFRRSASLGIFAMAVATACATSPTGRSQLELFSKDEVAQMGNKSYEKIRERTPVSNNPRMNRYVDCVANHLTTAIGPPPSGGDWQVTAFDRPKTVNAFALPGGNIGVYSGLLKVADNESQLAAVLGHEIGHVEAGHGNERTSERYATGAGLQLIQILSGAGGTASGQAIMAALGVGAQVGLAPCRRSRPAIGRAETRRAALREAIRRGRASGVYQMAATTRLGASLPRTCRRNVQPEMKAQVLFDNGSR